tara:strand:+ start:7029 stop:8813 length:1785 start_codon:yes stop_codon:yes gene_type:complete
MTLGIGSKNLLRSLQILSHLVQIGVKYFILCPGSRSAPLAIAAGEFYKRGKIELYNSIDERSAGFHGLGISKASGEMTAVITTSGTAVANLLPSAVEADRSNNPIIFLTADRPFRLKNCGANQTVNQEDFLKSVCRKSLMTNQEGLHCIDDLEIEVLIKSIKEKNSLCPGPIHLNIPIEKPLITQKNQKNKILDLFDSNNFNKISMVIQNYNSKELNQFNSININQFNCIDLSKAGIIIVGPYQGSTKDINEFNKALEKLQNLSGWPVFADPCSGVNSKLRGVIDNWELIISNKNKCLKCDQLLRLGPLPTSDYLDEFLKDFKGLQILIKERNSRSLDPFKRSLEYEYGLNKFVNEFFALDCYKTLPNKSLIKLASELINEGNQISKILKKQLVKTNKITELSVANLVPRYWPENLPIMLSASSPIRDWLTFSENRTLSRRCFSFRGASGIDGTLSMALGVSRIHNPLLLVTGDLAFLHDINGWLIENCIEANLTILLLDNEGGNIFNRLYEDNLDEEEINKLFVMPKVINWERMAETYSIPYRIESDLNNLKDCFQWSLAMPKSSIIKVSIDKTFEIYQRRSIFNSIYGNVPN